MEKHKKLRKLTTAYLLSFAFQLGYTIIIPLIICIAGGAWLDSLVHTKPLLLIVGSILGFSSSIYLLYKTVHDILN